MPTIIIIPNVIRALYNPGIPVGVVVDPWATYLDCLRCASTKSETNGIKITNAVAIKILIAVFSGEFPKRVVTILVLLFVVFAAIAAAILCVAVFTAAVIFLFIAATVAFVVFVVFAAIAAAILCVAAVIVLFIAAVAAFAATVVAVLFISAADELREVNVAPLHDKMGQSNTIVSTKQAIAIPSKVKISLSDILLSFFH